MEPFVTRIGDVTIERVVPKSGPAPGCGGLGKDPKDPIPQPSVSLAKRDADGGDTISVSEDLQIFLKPPLSEKGSSSGLKVEGRKARGDDRMETSGTDDSGASESEDNEDHHRANGDSIVEEEDEVILAESVNKVKTSDVQQQKKSDEQVEVISDSNKITSSIINSNTQTALQNSIEAGTVSLEPVRTEQDKMQSDSVGDASEGKRTGEEGKGKEKEDCERGAGISEANKRKASMDFGTMHKKKKTSISGKDGSSTSSSDSEDKEDLKQNMIERKVANMRRNIREVMSENQLDEETLAAQRQEMERLRRVQEQQRIIREVQRQIALNRQNNKTQTRVISLLQGNSSLLKQIPSTSGSGTGGTQVRLPNTVLVKLAAGSGQGSGSGVQTNKKVFELLRVQKGTGGAVPRPNARGPAMSRTVLAKPRGVGPQVHMMTPSVSIAPVLSSPRAPMPSDSESDGEEDSEKEMMARAAALRKVAGKGKGKDVVTISSSSDDDDCILLSEPSSGDEGEPVDDPTNSGMHTNDLYNTPDEQGQVLVNVGHPAEEPDIFLAPQIARIIKPHQIGGVRFLYDNVVESLGRFNTSTGFGCILAHSMGLGKTLQVISFCDVFLRHTNARTVLCIMPINTLQNWLAEFNMWLPAPSVVNNSTSNNNSSSNSNIVGGSNSNSNSENSGSNPDQQQNIPTDVSGDSPMEVNITPEIRSRNFGLHVLNDSHKSLTGRARVIQEWSKGGGVLLIGYELYRQLSLKRPNKANTKKRRRKVQEEIVDVDEDDRNKALLEEMHAALVKPGADLVICDEGHRIKNSHASISQALKQIRSKRRVVLTGYPLQNNLLEYWCMVDFVRPNYLGTKTEFCNMFERPIQNGQCIDSTPQDIRLMRYRAHVLHSLLEGFVQRRSHSVLQITLPQKEEYVLLLRMTPFQRKLYDTFMNEVVRTKAVPNPLKAFAVCCKIWNHPDVLYYFLKKRSVGEDVDLDLEETTGAASTPLSAGGVIPPGRGAPAKRGRGSRGPRNPPGPKRERKGATPFRQVGNNKPAATITPQTTNLTSGGNMTSNTTSNTSTSNSSQCQTVPSMAGRTPVQQDNHGNNQSFNMMGQQNQSYNSSGSYADMQHYSSNNPPAYSFSNNSQTSNYDPNYSNNTYNPNNNAYGNSNQSSAPSQYENNGNYYPSNGSTSGGQQSGYDSNSMGSYYPSGPGNNQGNGFQTSGSGNNDQYWQQHPNHGYYQGGNSNQYYSGNTSASYGNTNPGEGEENPYYLGHHPHQQDQYGEYGSREQGNVYQDINSTGYMGEMTQNSADNSRNSTGGGNVSGNSQNQNNMNMHQNSGINSNNSNNNNGSGSNAGNSNMQNISVGNVQQNPGSDNMQNSHQTLIGNQQNNAANQNIMMDKSQNTIGTSQSPVGNQQNQGNQSPMGNSQTSLGNANSLVTQQSGNSQQNLMTNQQCPVRTSQNSMGIPIHNSAGNSHNALGASQMLLTNQQNSMAMTQNVMGNSQNSVGTQNSMGPSQNATGPPQSTMCTTQTQMGVSPNTMKSSQSTMGGPQNLIGHQQNRLSGPSNPITDSQNQMVGPQNPLSTLQNQMSGPQNPMSVTQNTIGDSQNQLGGPQNQMGGSQNQLGGSQNQMAGPQNQFVGPQNSAGGLQNLMSVSQNQIGGPQNLMSSPQNQMGGSQNSMGDLQNQMGGPQNPMNGPQNQMGGLQNEMNSQQIQIGGQQNSVSGSQNQMGGAPNPMRSLQNQVGGLQNSVTGQQNQMVGPSNPMSGSQNQLGSPHNPLNGQQNQMGGPLTMNGPHNQVGGPQNPMNSQPNQMGGPQNPMSGQLNQMGGPQNPMNSQPNQMGGPQNPMNGQTNQMGGSQNPMSGMGAPQNVMNVQLNQMGGPQNPVNGSQNQIGGPQIPMNGQPSQAGVLQNTVSGPQNRMGGPQNLMSGSQNQMMMPQNQMSSQQNSVGNPQSGVSSMSILQNAMGPPQNPIGGPQNTMAVQQTTVLGPQNSIGSSLNPTGSSQSPVGIPQNPVGASQNPMGISQSPLGIPQSPMGVTQNQMGGTQNPVGTPSNSMSALHNSVGSVQHPMGGPQNSMGTLHTPMGIPQNSMESTQNSNNATQTSLGTQNTMGAPQNSMSSQNSTGNSQDQMVCQNVIGNSQSTVGITQNQMVTQHLPVNTTQNVMGPPSQSTSIGTPQSPVGSSHNPMGTPQSPIGPPHNPMGTPQSPIGPPHNAMGTPQSPIGLPHNPMSTPQSPIGPPLHPMGTPQSPIGSTHNNIGSSQNMMGSQQTTIGVNHNSIGMIQNPIGMPQSPMGMPQSPMGMSQNPMGPPQNLMSSHIPMGMPQNPVVLPQNSMGSTQNSMVTSQNSGSTSQNSVGTQSNALGKNTVGPSSSGTSQNSSQNLMGTSNSLGGPQNPIQIGCDSPVNTSNSTEIQNTLGSNSQNPQNMMQNSQNHLHNHSEVVNTNNSIGNNMQSTYSRATGVDSTSSDQSTSYNMSSNMPMNSYHQGMQNNNKMSSLQQGSSSSSNIVSDFKMCGVPSNNMYGSSDKSPYVNENMGTMSSNKMEAGNQSTLSNVSIDNGSSAVNNDTSMYNHQSGNIPYPSRWEDSTNRFPGPSQQDENKVKCEGNESQHMLTGGNYMNKDKLKFGNEDSCNSNTNNNTGEGSDKRMQGENNMIGKESYQFHNDCGNINDIKVIEANIKIEQDSRSNTMPISVGMQHSNGNFALNNSFPDLKTEEKIISNCSNETQTDNPTMPYGSLNMKTDMCTMSNMATQHNALKMEPGTFKTENLSPNMMSSSQFQSKEREIKEFEVNSDNKDIKPTEGIDGRRNDNMVVESKDASCGTPNFDCPKDLNLNEGKHVVELGTGSSRGFNIKEDPGIPYDWAVELLKNYIPGSIENSAKMEVLFCILEESMALGDRMLVFSQSLFTLNLIEEFLQRTNLPGRQEKWARNWNYYRLDGSTSALEREKLINEYNSNPNIHLFLVSTRAGSLGINLVGANRVVVFDASWNPCHDTQAVCRVYRYGQKKPCFVYRLVMDNCLEKKIYDRQINKQGMADRVVDECNPDAHLSIKEVTNLCWDNEQDSEPKDFSTEKEKYIDVVMQKVLDRFGTLLSKEPFQHESLLVDRKEKKLSQAEKRLAKRSYELEKQANINYSHRPQYSYYPGSTSAVGTPGMQGTGLQIRAIRTDGTGGVMPKPVASVRPMQAELSQQLERGQTPRSTVTTLNTGGRSRWIPAEVWQRQGMSAQEMTLPLDVVIPTNSPDRASIVLKAGQRVMVLKSPKGIYMQLENGKIIAIRTAFKVGGAGKGAAQQQHQECKSAPEKPEMVTTEYKKEGNVPPTINRTANATKISNVLPFKNNSAITIIPKNALPQQRPSAKPMSRMAGGGIIKQDVTVKPWGPRMGSPGGDVSSMPIGLNKSISMQQPMAQARPYFHRTSNNSSTDLGPSKPYYHHHHHHHHESSSDHMGMMGHQTSDEGSSGAENMSSTHCSEDKDGMDVTVLKSPSSDDFNQDNSVSSHAFGSRSSYDGPMNDEVIHEGGSSMSMPYGNTGDHGMQDSSMNSSFGRQDSHDSSVNRSFRRQVDPTMQGSGNVSNPYGRQTDQRMQDISVGLNRGYGRQMDQSMHETSSMNQGYGRTVDQGYHEISTGANRGFGRQMDQETSNINRSFGRQTHESVPYNPHTQGGVYSEHKDSNFGRSDPSGSGRYCHSESDSGTNRNYHATYEESWQQNQGYRGVSRVGSGQGHGGENVTENRNYQQQFKNNPHGIEKHSITDSSNRDQRNTYSDFSQRQQHQQSESPSFRSDISDSALNDSGIEILPLPTPSFSTGSKNTVPQQAGNMSSQGKTTSLKSYRHNTFNAQLHSREIESHTSSENAPVSVNRQVGEKSQPADHYMKSQQSTYNTNDIKSPPGFHRSHDELKSANQSVSIQSFSLGGSTGSLSREHPSSTTVSSSFMGPSNSGTGQHTLQSPKGRQKNPSNVGRFNSDVSTSGSFTGSSITTSTKGKRGSRNSNNEQQHYEFESHETASDVTRMNLQQHTSNKSVGRNQMYSLQQTQPYQSHTSPQQGPPQNPPNSTVTSTGAKKVRGSKTVQSDRSPSYSGTGSNGDTDSQHHTDNNSSNSVPKNQGQQQQSSIHNTPSQSPQSTSNFPSSQFPAMDNSPSKPIDSYNNPMYGHQQYFPAPGYYGGYGGPQQPPVGFGSGPYYSSETQYGTGRGLHMDQSAPPGNKTDQDVQKGNQTQTGTPSQQQQQQHHQTQYQQSSQTLQQQQQQQQQSSQSSSQPTTPVTSQQNNSGLGLQKKEQTSQLGNSTVTPETSNKTATSVTNPSTPTTVRDMASPSSVSGGSHSGNNSACSTPATVANTNISQEPSSPQVHFNTPTTSTNSTSPVQYSSSMSTASVPPDPKSPVQYSSSTSGGNVATSTSSSSSSSSSSLQYNANSTPNAPQGSLLPPPPHQSAYESMMLGGYPAGATGTGYAPPPPPAMGYGSYSNPANQYDTDYARASMYSAFHRPDPHPHPFAPGHPPGFLPPPPPPQSTNYYPQNMYTPAPYGTPDPAYYSNPFLNAMHQHPYPTLPGTTQNPGAHPQ